MSHIRTGAILLLSGLIPSTAAAQAGPSSGTLVAAALETGGYVSQAQVLANLLSMFERLGGLIYLCCILSAIVITALSGRYQAALWLIVGPAMFFFLMRTDRVASGVDWQFGTFHDRYDLDRVLRGARISQADGQTVSAFFHHYNVLVSTTVQQLIKIVNNNKVRTKLIFMARAKIIDDLFSSNFSTPGLWQLARYTFLMCHDELTAARTVAHGQRDPRFRSTPQYRLATEEYCYKYPLQNKTLPAGPAHDLVQRLYRELPLDVFDTGLVVLSCEELWQYMFLGAYDEMHRNTRETLLRHLNLNFRDEMDEEEIEQIRDETLESIRNHLAQRQTDGRPSFTTFKCTRNSAGQLNVGVSNLMHGIPVIMATWMLRQAAGLPATTGRQDAMVFPSSHLEPAAMGQSRYSSRNRAQSNGIVQRFKADQLAESMKYEVFTIAKMLPYLQGAGLYFLATLYPFFCLLVILPGHAGGLFLWMTLWAWFKLWDVGWALVYVADGMLWEMMPRRSYYRMNENSIEISVDPVTIFEAAFAGDYGYSLTTYWILVGTMMSAVPILSAHAVLGAKKAVAGIFLEGVKSMGKVFSQTASDWLAMEQLETVDRQQQNRLMHRAIPNINRDIAAMHRLQQAYNSESLRAANTNVGAQLRNGGVQFANFGISLWNNVAPENWRIQELPAPPAIDAGPISNDPNNLGNRVLTHFQSYRFLGGPFWGRTFDQHNENILQQLAGDLDAYHTYLSTGGQGGTRETLFARLFGNGPNAWRPASVVDPIAGSGSPDQTAALQANEIMRQDAMIAAAISRFTDELSRRVAAGTISVAVARRIFSATSRNRFFAAIGRTLNSQSGGAAVNAGATFAAELQRFSTATRVLSLEMDRSANQHASVYLHNRSQQHFYEALRSDEFAMLERIRAGITGRAEWWSIPEGAAQAYARAPIDLSIMNARLTTIGQGWLGRLDANVLQGSFNVLNSAVAGYLQQQNRRIPPPVRARR